MTFKAGLRTPRLVIGFSALALLVGSAACAGKTDGSPTAGASLTPGSNPGSATSPDPACAGKRCGAPCPSTSDEAFVCDAAGKCVDPWGPGVEVRCESVDGAACAGKACGTSCTPAGSDEPFVCNASAQCISMAESEPLDCGPPSCSGKSCGQDCSPPGSDEAFSCNAAGACVPVGTSAPCGPATSPECNGKVCGQNCTPAGSDEPFTCNAKGECVAAGTAVTCGSPCAEFLGDCPAGTKPVDTDGDTCIDACK